MLANADIAALSNNKSVADCLVEWVANHLKIPHTEVNLDSLSFFYLGFDSVALAEFIHNIEKTFGIQCELDQLYESSSLRELVTYIENKIIPPLLTVQAMD